MAQEPDGDSDLRIDYTNEPHGTNYIVTTEGYYPYDIETGKYSPNDRTRIDGG